MKQKLTTLVLALALCLSLLPAQAMAAQAEVSVTIFTTNDMHGTLEGDGTLASSRRRL